MKLKSNITYPKSLRTSIPFSDPVATTMSRRVSLKVASA